MREDGWVINLDPKDWTIVNTEDTGGPNHYGVKLWSGAGYFISPYSVWADDEMDALTLVAEWCANHGPGMIVKAEEVFDTLEEYMSNYISDHPESFDMSEEDIEDKSDKEICRMLYNKDRSAYYDLKDKIWEDEYMDEWVTETENPDIYVRTENMWVSPWPEDYPSPEDE